MADSEIDVVLPCLNEAAGLAWVLDRLPGWAPWARTGSRACRHRATRAGFAVAEEWSAAGRTFLSLRPTR